mgnify:CR=1 FL=1
MSPKKFINKAKDAGVDGVLVVDLPPEVSEELSLELIAYPNPTFDRVLFKGEDDEAMYYVRVVDKLTHFVSWSVNVSLRSKFFYVTSLVFIIEIVF